MTTRGKPVHGDGAGALVPSYFEDELDRLRRENGELRAKNQAQRHALKELNKVLRYLLKTFRPSPLAPLPVRPVYRRRTK